MLCVDAAVGLAVRTCTTHLTSGSDANAAAQAVSIRTVNNGANQTSKGHLAWNRWNRARASCWDLSISDARRSQAVLADDTSTPRRSSKHVFAYLDASARGVPLPGAEDFRLMTFAEHVGMLDGYRAARMEKAWNNRPARPH
jgi:hypothetical protein